MKRWLLILLLVLLPLRAEAGERMKILVPEPQNLQFLVFWVAHGAGAFAKEGIDLEIVSPERPRESIEVVKSGAVEIAVLPPPMCLELIASETPIVLVANLLANDAINLVVRRKVVEERKVPLTGPIKDRLLALHGLKIGIAPNPPPRLRALFASQGLDADKDIEMVILGGKQQNAAFAAGEVDALYAHTPFLETALVEQDAVMVVNQSAGEAPALAARQIHALVVARNLASKNPSTVYALVRAMGVGAGIIRRDQKAAVDAVMTALPTLDRRKVEAIVAIYAPAIPTSLKVDAEGLRTALALFPGTRKAPSLEGIHLSQYFDGRFVIDPPVPVPPKRSRPWIMIVPFLALLSSIWILRRRLSGTSS